MTHRTVRRGSRRTGRIGWDRSRLSLYLVSDSALCSHRGVLSTVRAAVRGGATAVQVREPRAPARQVCEMARAVHEALTGSGVPLFVNDRLDIALAVGAEGVHLGQSDLPIDRAREIAGPNLLIGLSVSTLRQTEAADALPEGTVDYLGVGPVFATATKPTAAPALGLSRTARIRERTSLPCVAIGGIDAANAPSVLRTGVDGLAVVSAICAAADPRGAALALRRAVAEASRQ